MKLKTLAISSIIAFMALTGSYFAMTGHSALGAGDSTVGQAEQWKATSTPIQAITQRIFGRPLVLTGYSEGCAQFTATGTLISTGVNCGSGSGGLATSSILNLFNATSPLVYSTSSSSGTFSISTTTLGNTFVPYTGATANVNLGNFTITAASTTGTSSIRNLAASTTVLTLGPVGQGSTTTLDALNLQTATSATSTSSQNSPAVVWSANGWKTNSTAASQPVKFKSFVQAITGTANPSGAWKLLTSINNEVFREIFRIDSMGQAVIDTQQGAGATTTLEIKNTFGNGTLGTTRSLRLTSKSGGSYGWIDWFFEGLGIKGGIGVNSSGSMYLGFIDSLFISNGSSFTSPILQIYGGGIYNYGGIFNSGYVTAGLANTSAPSTFTDYGSFGAKTRLITSSETLGSTDTQILVDGSTAFACSGTPSSACSSYGSQGTCEANQSHNGCTWNPGNSCDVFNYEYGMGSCSGTSGCSVDTSGCTGSDQSSCESGDDSYGGSCTWSYGNDCSGISDESTCSGTSGCSTNYSACSWDSGMSTCGGGTGCDSYMDESSCNAALYFSGCYGTYGAGCSGSYNTGSCSGTYGTSCSGTASCSGFLSSGTCSAETGCTSITGLNVTLPAEGNAPFYRTYWIKNIGATGTVAILPNTGQYIEQASTTLNLSRKNASAMFSFYKQTADCSAFNSSEATCGSTSGCSQNYQDCSGFTDESSCTTDSHCSWNGSSCDNGNHFHSCSGTYTTSKNWYIMSSHLVDN